MSDENKEMPQVSLIDQFKQQRAQFVQQKEFAQNNLNQLIGAIFACDLMIKKHEDEALKLSGGQGDGEADEQEEKQAA
jgi:hypothetical protein